MATALERARVQELDRERLQAFRETARRVAHEMRGPLSAARLALRQLEGKGDTIAVSVLTEETARLEQMATEFSQFGRLPEGPESEIDVTELVNGLVASTLPPDLVYQVSVDLELRVHGHFEPLRRAIQNLIRNAIDATDNRGIAIAASREDHNIVVRVTDHGPGVPPDMRARVFEPYFTTKSGGTGLGLAMVQQIVKEHDGVVRIEDGETGGAVFVVSIPEAM
jgi:signal transduction histidine kinase